MGEWYTSSEIGQMNIQLKLLAVYRRYLPSDDQGDACDLEVAAGTRIADLLARFGIPADASSVILINGRSTDPERPLEDGDIVAVFPAMAGG